jgi:uncharacterized protein
MTIKAFAGRRGSAFDPDRCLLPMTFRQFCSCLGVADRSIAAVRPDELRTDMARDVWQNLVPATDNLVAAWQAYVEVGGYPKAVSDWRAHNRVEPSTWGALWDVVRGEAVTDQVNEAAVAGVMSAVARRLTSTFAVRPTAEDLGMRHETLERRIDALIATARSSAASLRPGTCSRSTQTIRCGPCPLPSSPTRWLIRPRRAPRTGSQSERTTH